MKGRNPSTDPQGERTRNLLGLALLLAVIGVTSLFLLPKEKAHFPKISEKQKSSEATQIEAPDLLEPAEDFETFLYVLTSGGCEVTRPVAIAWLDRLSRENIAMDGLQSARIMEMISNSGHASWSPSYRQHLFNSAFNALHRCDIGQSFTLLLLQIAEQNPDRILRLYALQHLGSQRRVGHLPDGELSEKVRRTLEGLARAPEEEVSGYAIDLLVNWNGNEDEESEPDGPLRDLALATAADKARTVDIRVTALHAAGSAVLPLARQLAVSEEEHLMLRKAAISRIGLHGTSEDVKSLESLRQESARLAQAAEPALARLKRSETNKPNSEFQLPRAD